MGGAHTSAHIPEDPPAVLRDQKCLERRKRGLPPVSPAAITPFRVVVLSRMAVIFGGSSSIAACVPISRREERMF